jgi:hypothetical protein
MPVNLEKLSFRTDKGNRDAEVRVNRHSAASNQTALPAGPPPSKEAPPTYTATDPLDASAGPSLDELSAAFSNLTLPVDLLGFPTADQCLAHLKLLNSFHTLREDVEYTDGLFGIWDARCEVLEGKERDQALAKTREKRWALFIARAVERFEVWWLKFLCSLEPNKRLEGKEMTSSSFDYTLFMGKGKPRKWTTAMLPPLGNDPSLE